MSDNEFVEFMDKLGGNKGEERYSGAVLAANSVPQPQIVSSGDSVQWSVLGNDSFSATGATVPQIPAGVYRPSVDNYGRILLTKGRIITDELLRLPDTASDRVLEGIKIFWESKLKFKAKGQLFKRGVLLWGPPGSGKTSTVMLLIHDLVKRGGLVVLVHEPELVTRALEEMRRIEPERPIICVMEDLDELIRRNGEASMLSLLDGENQIDNVVHVATTNYPEELDPRFVNRPSRFDEVIKIGMPSAEARHVYLKSRVSVVEVSDLALDQWVADTEGMSIAHLREIVVAVFCLGRSYKETLDRLRAMKRTPKSTGDVRIGMAS